MEEAEIGKRLIGWFCWFLDCGFEELARRTGFNEKTLRLWAKGKNPIRRSSIESLAGGAGLPMAFVDAVLLPSLATLRLGQVAEDEVFQELAGVAREAEASLAGLGRAAVAELATYLEEHPSGVRESAADQWKRLKSRSDAELWYLAEALPELRTPELVELIAYASEDAASHDFGRALTLSRVAFRLAELVGGEEAEGWALEALALAFIANALRVGNDIQTADEAFTRALNLWAAAADAGQILLPRWRLLDLEGSLRRDQRRFSDSLSSLAEAQEGAPSEAVAWILVKRALTLEYMGDPEGAIEVLQEAAPLADQRREPRLLWTIHLNTGVNLVHLGRYEEAERLLPRIQEQALVPSRALDGIRILWLRAKIWAGLGSVADARAAFDQVRNEYETRTMAANYAVVSLERAVLDLQEGRYAEVRELADEMAWIFKSKGLHSEALAALALFRRAAKREELTVELAERMVRFLYRAQYEPGLKFEA